MLSLNEIIDFCTLTEGEVRAIAEHEIFVFEGTKMASERRNHEIRSEAAPTIQSISAVTLATRDMSQAVNFYRALGFEIRYGGESAAFTSFKAGPNYLNLIAQSAASAGPGGAGSSFTVQMHKTWSDIQHKVDPTETQRNYLRGGQSGLPF
jgi:catechol-2,3-dioxygenase